MPQWAILLGAIVTTAGAVVVAFPLVLMRKATVAKVSATVYGVNPDLAMALVTQRRFAAAGIVMIIVGTVIQMLGSVY